MYVLHDCFISITETIIITNRFRLSLHHPRCNCRSHQERSEAVSLSNPGQSGAAGQTGRGEKRNGKTHFRIHGPLTHGGIISLYIVLTLKTCTIHASILSTMYTRSRYIHIILIFDLYRELRIIVPPPIMYVCMSGGDVCDRPVRIFRREVDFALAAACERANPRPVSSPPVDRCGLQGRPAHRRGRSR